MSCSIQKRTFAEANANPAYIWMTEAAKTFAEANANPAYICPLSHKLMVDPVMTEAGRTYNRDAINKWFDHCVAANLVTTDPLTQTVVNPSNLVPNNALRSAIGEYLSQIVLPAKRQRSASEAMCL